MILLDTNALIDLPASHLDEEWVSSTICLGELRFGVQNSEGDVQRKRIAHVNLLTRSGMKWFPFDEQAAESYGILAAYLSGDASAKARNKDTLIAAQAHSLGVPLFTRNTRDFVRLQKFITILGDV